MYWTLFSSPVDSAVELHQKFLMTKAATKTAIIECTFPSACYSYIHWYQKKDGETLKRVQYVDISDGTIKNDPGFEFLKSEKKADDQFVLKIPNLKTEHSANYCACWVSGVTQRGNKLRFCTKTMKARSLSQHTWNLIKFHSTSFRSFKKGLPKNHGYNAIKHE